MLGGIKKPYIVHKLLSCFREANRKAATNMGSLPRIVVLLVATAGKNKETA